MNQTEIHEKAIRLLEGGHVEVDGHWVFAQIASDQYYPCECCEMDSICTQDSESMSLPDWASLELSPSVESCGCGLGPSPVRLG